MEKTIQELENEFYAQKYYLSYSALNKLLYSPLSFYKHYVLQQKEEKPESYLVEGKIIHSIMLKNFEDTFIVSHNDLPTDSVKLVLDKLYYWCVNDQKITDMENVYLSDYEEKIIEILKEINLHQSLVDDKKTGETGDEKRLKKIVTPGNVSYFDFLKNKGKKILVDQTTVDNCQLAVSALLNNAEIYHLLGMDDEMRDIDVFNEVPIQSDLLDIYPFGFKGILDNLVIDNDTNTIYINDLKSTSKTISEFRETIDFYKYWIQASIYSMLVKDKFKEKDYKYIFTFVVVDKYNQVYAFEVSSLTMMNWEIEFIAKADEFQYHYVNRSFSLPYKFLTEKVVL